MLDSQTSPDDQLSTTTEDQFSTMGEEDVQHGSGAKRQKCVALETPSKYDPDRGFRADDPQPQKFQYSSQAEFRKADKAWNSRKAYRRKRAKELARQAAQERVACAM